MVGKYELIMKVHNSKGFPFDIQDDLLASTAGQAYVFKTFDFRIVNSFVLKFVLRL